MYLHYTNKQSVKFYCDSSTLQEMICSFFPATSGIHKEYLWCNFLVDEGMRISMKVCVHLGYHEYLINGDQLKSRCKKRTRRER